MKKTSIEDCNDHSDSECRNTLPEAPIQRTLIIVDGGKGGVGKSLVAAFIASALLADGERVTLIEADQANPDTARRFQYDAPVLLADLSDRDGWITLLGVLESINTPYIVMSLPAGLNGVEGISGLLQDTLVALGINVQLIFCMARQFDSVALIEKSQKTGIAIFANKGLALTNGFFGREETFDRWLASAARQHWYARGFQEAHLPELNHRLVDAWESNPAPIHRVLTSGGLTIVLRLELENWMRSARKAVMDIVVGV